LEQKNERVIFGEDGGLGRVLQLPRPSSGNRESVDYHRGHRSEFRELRTGDPVELAIRPRSAIGPLGLSDLEVIATTFASAEVLFLDLQSHDPSRFWAAVSPGLRTAHSVFLALVVATALAKTFGSGIQDESNVLQQGIDLDVESATEFLRRARDLPFSKVSELFPEIYPEETDALD
jgi:hypothetical protein